MVNFRGSFNAESAKHCCSVIGYVISSKMYILLDITYPIKLCKCIPDHGQNSLRLTIKLD